MATVPIPWPSHEVCEHLVSKSSGYFIYASTIIKFIDDKNFRPTERLGIIMGITEPDSGSPYSALDQLYTQILSGVPTRSQLFKILTVIAANGGDNFRHIPWPFKVTFSVKSTNDIEQLLDLRPGDVRLMLRGLHSLINVEYGEDANGEPEEDSEVIVHHTSFLDFLNDPARSAEFH
ncbi:hypothetical protein B0H17DRAFT_1299017, partial [Mycena rosella]